MKVKITKNKDLTKAEKELINNARDMEWGRNEKKDFEEDYEREMIWFFIKEKEKIVSLGGLRPIAINYLGKRYNILGICSVLSIEKNKGYGRALIGEIIEYLKKKNKTGLGFTKKNEFFKKVGLKSEKDFIKRFIYKNLKIEKEIIDNDGDGVYYEGKDKFISNILKTKSIVYIDILHW
ncbi:MAG: GNAT family N-acetyltransferase [archaeon]